MRRGWTRSRLLAAVAVSGALALTAAACGGSGGSGGGSDKAKVVVGTTDKVISYDPAGAYDLGSWTVIYNTYQRLLRYPPGQTTPQPDAAKSCEFTDEENTVYVCTLKKGLKFANGSPLTAKDVVFSFERVVEIDDPKGPASIIENMKSIEAVNSRKVKFTLKEPDATWPHRIATNAGAIVPSDVYSKNKLQPDTEIVGSGAYKLKQYEPGQRAVLVPNEHYKGARKTNNGGVILTYFEKPSALKLAVENGEIDVAYRNLSPTAISDLRKSGNENIRVVEGAGTEIRYLVFETGLEPGNKLAVRKAFALSIDRQQIAKKVYNGTVEPLYSMVPQGVKHATQPFKKLYGTKPDPKQAKKLLEDAGIKTPVPITLWYTPSHYGAVSADEYLEVKRQVEGNGLFKVTLKSAEWQQYSKAYTEDQYPLWQLGWFPDFPDADNYIGPFFLEGGYYQNSFNNERMNELIRKERSSTDPQVRKKAFRELQRIAAEKVYTLPLWQGKQVAVVNGDVHGVKKTFDASFVFRMWLISKGK